MTKKEQYKRYKKLLEAKVESLGVKDEITYRPSGRAKLVPKPGLIINKPATKADVTPEWIKTNFDEQPSYVAQNYQRNLVKRMLKMEPSVIEAFLKADLNPAGKAVPSAPPAIAEVMEEPNGKTV